MSKNQTYILVAGGCLLALCVGITVAVGAIYMAPWVSDKLNPSPPVVSVTENSYSNANGNSMGDPNAPIQMEEFGDFQCPFCQRFHEQTEPSLIEQYVNAGKVYFTYRSAGNWVSQNIGGGKTESQDAAASAYCAGDQGKFWEMHNILFANILGEDAGSFTDKRLASLAETIGLEMTAFNDCYSSGKYKGKVQQDYTDAIASSVQGTPSFLVTYTVNGEAKTKLIEGAQPFNIFKQELDAILQEIEK